MRKADSKTDISDATVSLTNEKKLVSVVDKDHPVTLSKEDIEVTLGDKVLRYGIDYKLTYNNNEAPGTASEMSVFESALRKRISAALANLFCCDPSP